MTEARKIPLWQSHKVVGAFKIGCIVHTADGGAELHPENGETFAPVKVHGHYLGRNEPRVGGYFVQYEDGYTSYSPASTFEAGYSRLGVQGAHAHAKAPA